jgi:hypothetical protein
MLRIYVSAQCPGCDTARARLERLRAERPDIPALLVDVAAPGAAAPRVIGTPIYTWRERILFLGNPSEQELLERVTVLHGDDPSRRAG